MRDYIRKRVVDISRYIVEARATVRQAAAVFGVSKSTVHKDVTERLPRVSKDLARKVKRILDLNKAERHIRGGEATRRKYRRNQRARVLASGTAGGSLRPSRRPDTEKTLTIHRENLRDDMSEIMEKGRKCQDIVEHVAKTFRTTPRTVRTERGGTGVCTRYRDRSWYGQRAHFHAGQGRRRQRTVGRCRRRVDQQSPRGR